MSDFALAPFIRFVLDDFEDAIFVVDDAQNLVYCNASARHLTGASLDEVIGRHCSAVFGGAGDEAYCVFQELRGRDEPHPGSHAVIRRGDGLRIPVEIRLTRVPAEVAGAPLMIGRIRDLSVLDRLQAEAAGRWRFSNMVSRSPAMLRVFELVRAIADTDVSVLVTGESGTGKELVARAIHDLSPRREGPFHAVNCGALASEILDSEIFGHEKGAFTGAVRQKPGRIELAGGGTLFLDELGEMPAPLQVKLLRVLQERTFERVGGTRTLEMDARIIAATNADLARAVAEGRFRQDLYFRLAVVPIHLPPLRERREDIELLLEHHLRVAAERFRRPEKRFSEQALRVLINHDWPGNVRELINVVEYALAVAPGGVIEPRDLPPALLDTGDAAARTLRAIEDAAKRAGLVEPESTDLSAAPWRIGRDELVAALARNRNRRDAAAAELGISRTTLWRRMKELGLR